MIEQLRLVRGKNQGSRRGEGNWEDGQCWWENFMYFLRAERRGRFRIYPRLGFTLRSDGKMFVEEGVHWIATKGPQVRAVGGHGGLRLS